MFDFQLEEELLRVRYILSEGDAAAYLPSKSHGFVHYFFFFLFIHISFTRGTWSLYWGNLLF